MPKVKTRNWIAVAAFQRSGAGKHKSKALKGGGRKGYRHPKHKNQRPCKEAQATIAETYYEEPVYGFDPNYDPISMEAESCESTDQ